LTKRKDLAEFLHYRHLDKLPGQTKFCTVPWHPTDVDTSRPWAMLFSLTSTKFKFLKIKFLSDWADLNWSRRLKRVYRLFKV